MDWVKPVMSRTFELEHRSVAPVTEPCVFASFMPFFSIQCPVPDPQRELLYRECGWVIDAKTCVILLRQVHETWTGDSDSASADTVYSS
jgi:hypothetical protein